ncbi:hypothetical protein [Mobilisporobacter senegalensis]|uniref:hypothetical protein n=1 Tax=Mobilisporobacter senegalensis TaxID=1329262 RepID=UPI0014729992|nr:hypothetical protein [Mobilisporobacter senegalensis]
MEKVIHVHCPSCRNKRLFDLDENGATGIVRIKCPVCKSVVEIKLNNIKRN